MSDKAVGSVADRPHIGGPSPAQRSRVTNGSALLTFADNRSAWARRMRDLMALHLSDLGGEAAVSAAEKSLVRRAATLTVELERMEERFATDGEADAEAQDLHTQTFSNLRRLLQASRLKLRARGVTPAFNTCLEGQPA